VSYREIEPSLVLKPLIQCYWVMESPADSPLETHTVMPDGCFDIVIDIQPSRKNDVVLTGIWDQPITVELVPGRTTVGVRFYPAAIDVFFSCRVSDYNNSAVPLNPAMMKAGDDTVASALFEYETPEELVIVLDAYFAMTALNSSEENQILLQSRECSQGETVEAFAEISGISSRQLSRLYQNRFGISTKTYFRILRFLQAKALLMGDSGLEHAEIAVVCQYTDQAHFIKEFKRFTGLTPTAFRKRYQTSDFYNT